MQVLLTDDGRGIGQEKGNVAFTRSHGTWKGRKIRWEPQITDLYRAEVLGAYQQVR